MKPLKKGPKIKKPELRAPKVVSDLYRDLRDRHLLPLVAVLAVAVVAVPVALGESTDSEAKPGGGAEPAGISRAASPARNIVVAKDSPGLRSFHQRFRHRTAADPFEQQFDTPEKEEGSTDPGEASEGGSSGSPSGEAPVETSEGGGEPTATHSVKYFTYEIDVRVVPVSTNGVPSKAEPTVRHGLPELTMLPGRKTPGLIFMQPSADREKALMLVTSNVTAIFGDGVCVAGGDTCQLLALKPGVPETIVYGGNERIFRIELLKVDLVYTDHLEKAPLGEPEQSG
jgi:hypothetical protein